MATSIRPHHPARPRLRPLANRRAWRDRFWDPREMFGLKVTLLLCCYLFSAALV
jgi:hypothetical protein